MQRSNGKSVCDKVANKENKTWKVSVRKLVNLGNDGAGDVVNDDMADDDMVDGDAVDGFIQMAGCHRK